MGSWIVYGLGSESQNLPAYMVLSDPGGHAVDGTLKWSSGFMPPLYQGTVLRAQEPRILNLDPPPHLRGDLQRQNLDFLNTLNKKHLEKHAGESDLETRIASYELAAAMQTAAKEALDISQEPASIHKLYGIDNPPTRSYGSRCLVARRLVERGVRFVQLFLGGQPWDNHTNIRQTLPNICNHTDRPAAATVMDQTAACRFYDCPLGRRVGACPLRVTSTTQPPTTTARLRSAGWRRHQADDLLGLQTKLNKAMKMVTPTTIRPRHLLGLGRQTHAACGRAQSLTDYDRRGW